MHQNARKLTLEAQTLKRPGYRGETNNSVHQASAFLVPLLYAQSRNQRCHKTGQETSVVSVVTMEYKAGTWKATEECLALHSPAAVIRAARIDSLAVHTENLIPCLKNASLIASVHLIYSRSEARTMLVHPSLIFHIRVSKPIWRILRHPETCLCD